MARRSRRTLVLILGATVLVALLLAIVWAAAPDDLRGSLMLAGGVVAVATYAGLYVIERDEHWGS
jgi:hypothetical protein